MSSYTYFKLVLILSVLGTSPSLAAGDKPWRIENALPDSERFSISGEHRTRFETLDEQYQGARSGGDQAMMFRTLVEAVLKFNSIRYVAELEDARVVLADSGTSLSTTSVNPLELLQAYAEISLDNTLIPGSKSSIKGGRITMDVGSRRLVARNSFRNTINAFTGVDWQWTGPENNRIRAFYVLPVQRLVGDGILDNKAKFDKEHKQVRFWGVYYQPDKLPWGDKGEVYLFGLNEKDAPGWATLDRELYTTGFRLYRNPARQQFDYQIESVYQFGESRDSASSTIDLDHFAHFQHVEIGYTFDAPMSPQLLFQYDYASGDDNPSDGDNNRFDTLFGARRFDFGPTSIYGAFARSNISTPGLRLKFKPRPDMSSFFSLRSFWLAAAEDEWTTAGISNAPGSSANHIGTQIEAQLRWEAVPGNIQIEAGAAYLYAGELMENANKNNTAYVYGQIELFF